MTDQVTKPREERARDACRWLIGRINDVVSPSRGAQLIDSPIVNMASEAFLKALSQWERTGHDSDFKSVRDRGDGVVRAYEKAAAQAAA